MLPDMDGFEITRRLRLEKETFYYYDDSSRLYYGYLLLGLIVVQTTILSNHLQLKNSWLVFVPFFRRQDVEFKREQGNQGKEGLLGLRLKSSKSFSGSR